MKVALAVTGCIGAYKAALILRSLQKEGFEVVPVMTRSAKRFLGPLTLEKLSGRRVLSELFQDSSPKIQHITVAREIDLLLVAPATANILAKFATGIADDFLSTLYLSNTRPVVIAPAMNSEMWNHPATQTNLALLLFRAVAGHAIGIHDLSRLGLELDRIERGFLPGRLSRDRLLRVKKRSCQGGDA